MVSKKKAIFIYILIVILGLLLIGGTYAYLISSLNVTNGNYVHGTACFDIKYEDDTSSMINGVLFPVSSYDDGIFGSVAIGMDASCETDVNGNIYMNVVSASSTLVQTVSAHCENSKTLETLTNYTDSSSCTAQTNGIWVTDGTALKYAFVKENSTEPYLVGYIKSTGKTTLYSNFLLSTTTERYYLYIWLDGNLSDNSYTSLQVMVDMTADATVIY